MTSKEIGATIRRLREKLGISTTELARRVGISQPQISRLENGLQGFRSGTLIKIADVLGVPPFRLWMTDEEWQKWERTQ